MSDGYPLPDPQDKLAFVSPKIHRSATMAATKGRHGKQPPAVGPPAAANNSLAWLGTAGSPTRQLSASKAPRGTASATRAAAAGAAPSSGNTLVNYPMTTF